MQEIFDLGITDEEYVQLIAQGREPVGEHIFVKNLIRAGVPIAEAYEVAPLFKKVVRSEHEEMLVKRAWRKIRSQ